MLGVKYDNTTTWKIDGWLKDTLGHSNSGDDKFGQEGGKAAHPFETRKPRQEDVIKKDKPREGGKSLK